MMRSRIAVLAAGLLLLAGMVAAVGDAKPTLLGAKEVSFRVDRDELLVGLRDGTFSKLLFEVQDNDLEMLRVVVTYANGATDAIAVRHLFREGSRSRLIDLPGGRRIIRKIVFFYKTVGSAREGRAQVRVYGL